MHNKKIIAKGLVFGIVLSNVPVDSMANTIEEYKTIKEDKKELISSKENRMKGTYNKVSEVKNTVKVNENIIEGSVLEISLTDGEFISDLTGNPNGYETIRVTTTGNKKLVAQDYNNLRESGISKIDLSNSNSDSIPAGAFNNATHLIDFKFPQGITSIGGSLNPNHGAFYNCFNLTGDLVIPDSVENIGAHAFSNCTGLNGRLKLPESLKIIGAQAFSQCSKFSGNLTIPDSVTSIGGWAFSNCAGFTGNLIIPDSVKSIDDGAFSGCNGFDGYLRIGVSVINIGPNAFNGCSGFIGDLIIPDLTTNIGLRAFSKCSGFNGNLTIGNSVENIGHGAFEYTGFVGDLIIPDSTISIGEWAFYGCSGFNGNLIIGNLVTGIGMRAFTGCSGFTGDLVIPNSVTDIGLEAFAGCSGFDGNLTIGNSVGSIGGSSFSGCSGFTGDLTIPNSVISIGYGAFSGCSGLDGNVVISNSVVTMGTSVFYNCDKIKKILIGINSSDFDTNYREDVIKNLPENSKIIIDIPYDFDITGTWLETTKKTVGKPVIKNIVNGVESDLIDNKGEVVSLYIPSLCQESNITVLKDSKKFALPSKNSDGKHLFKEPGIYEVTVTTDLGNTSVITFEVEDPRFKIAEEAVEKSEISKNTVDVEGARDLVNNLPESMVKDQLQDRLDNIFSNVILERKTATANFDVYVKSQNMLSLSLDTNNVSFEDYSGTESMEKLNAVNIAINSSLPYDLNAYMPNEISNADGSNKIDLDILNIRESSEATYQIFENTTDKIVLKQSCAKGNDINHSIDLKLDSSDAHKADVYKTVIKFEAEQK